MNSLPGFLQGWPVGLVFGVLAAAAYTRGTLTYWLGRGLRAGGDRSRLGRHGRGPMMQAAERWVRRFGGPIVALGYLTVGIQTALVLAAGALRMPQRRFQPALVVGALIWSTIYTTVGFAVFDAWVGQLSWWWAAAAVAAFALMIVISRVITARHSEPARVDDAAPSSVTSAE